MAGQSHIFRSQCFVGRYQLRYHSSKPAHERNEFVAHAFDSMGSSGYSNPGYFIIPGFSVRIFSAHVRQGNGYQFLSE